MSTRTNLVKFKGEKPLLEYPNDYYPDKFLIQYHEFSEPKEFDLWDGMKCERVDLGHRRIVFGINAREEEFEKYDFLWCPDGPAFVVHQRVLEVLKRECPEDFQELPMVIKNLDPKGEQFENKSFWLINVLGVAEAFDKNYIRYSNLGVPKHIKKVLIEGSLGKHFLIRDKVFSSHILFHPKLAKHFIKSKGIQFLSDSEAPI